MSQPPCESLEEAIQKLSQDLDAIENQLKILEVEGMNQPNPWRYFALQPQVDRRIKKKHALQDAWNLAMYELPMCRWVHSSTRHAYWSRSRATRPTRSPGDAVTK